ncbi:MAG: HNH endonuclease [Candidatus Cloacimonetes bacterium]|nr:HNH endonuclease [Candidatus Cloacimonadota bacterium]
MNYSEHYSRLINHARNREVSGYSEKHHVLPRCMGGTDDRENLVRLTAREHFVAHQLLVKMYPGVGNLIFAVMAMCRDPHGKRVTNRLYSWLREAHSVHCNSPEILAKRRAAFLTRHAAGDPCFKVALEKLKSPEVIAKRVASRKITASTPEFKAKESSRARKRWETRDKTAVREHMTKMNKERSGRTKGSARVVVEVLPNGFIVNEHLDIKALALNRGVTYKALYQQLRAGHPTMEIAPR